MPPLFWKNPRAENTWIYRTNIRKNDRSSFLWQCQRLRWLLAFGPPAPKWMEVGAWGGGVGVQQYSSVWVNQCYHDWLTGLTWLRWAARPRRHSLGRSLSHWQNSHELTGHENVPLWHQNIQTNCRQNSSADSSSAYPTPPPRCCQKSPGRVEASWLPHLNTKWLIASRPCWGCKFCCWSAFREFIWT